MTAPIDDKRTTDVVLIGGGDLKVHAARLFMERGEESTRSYIKKRNAS